MKPPALLQHYRKLIDQEIARYSQQLAIDVRREYGAYSRASTEAFTAILARGGKRLRGALVIAAYEMLGGSDQATAVKVARTIEMIHAYLLMTDDIADRSDVRRGGPSAHKQISSYHVKHHLKGDPAHFGTSVTMMSALAHAHLAEAELDELPLPDKTKLQILKSLNDNLVQTLHGQLQDIFLEAIHEPKEADAMQVIKLKTAHYTLVNPLEVGGILAGATPEDIHTLQQYGMRAGIAFQLADDILGLTTETEQSGKSPLDDIKEGKATILIIRALDKSTPAQKTYLEHALGNPNLTRSDLEKCRDIIVETGALAYVQQVAAENAQAALRVLDRAPISWDPKHVEFLRTLTDYIVNRQT